MPVETLHAGAGTGLGERLDHLLSALLRRSPELEAAAVVSEDGLPMASQMPEHMDEDRVAAMSAALLSLGERAARELSRGDLCQIYVEGENGTVFLVSAHGQAVLVVVAERTAKVGLVMFELRKCALAVAEVLAADDGYAEEAMSEESVAAMEESLKAAREADAAAAADKAQRYAERIVAQRAAAEQAAAAREQAAAALAAEEAAAKRVSAESEDAAASAAEAERVEAERVEAEQAAAERVEAERVEAEQAAAERAEAERAQAERPGAERAAAERAEAERAQAERLGAERAEAERAEAGRLEVERAETRRIEAERLEAERLEAERAEAERLEAERAEAERLEAERFQAERLQAERAEGERVEAERLQAERAEAERLQAERAEAERLEAERLEAERFEAERLEAERFETERFEAERREQLEHEEQRERERIAAATAEQDAVDRAAAASLDEADPTFPVPRGRHAAPVPFWVSDPAGGAYRAARSDQHEPVSDEELAAAGAWVPSQDRGPVRPVGVAGEVEHRAKAETLVDHSDDAFYSAPRPVQPDYPWAVSAVPRSNGAGPA